MADILNEQSRGGIIDGSKAHATLHKGERVLSPKEARMFAEVSPQTAETGNNIGSIFIKLNVDIADALTGLKALQREAKKATQALRELESAQNDIPAHVKEYGKHDRSYTSKSTTQAWFKDGESQ